MGAKAYMVRVKLEVTSLELINDINKFRDAIDTFTDHIFYIERGSFSMFDAAVASDFVLRQWVVEMIVVPKAFGGYGVMRRIMNVLGIALGNIGPVVGDGPETDIKSITLSPLPEAPKLPHWTDYTVAEARDLQLDLDKDVKIIGPLNEDGARCSWPWEPEEVPSVPLGHTYNCGYCGARVVAGSRHPDYAST